MSAPNYLDELAWRGLLHQYTEGVQAMLAQGPTVGYAGFDPTARSLHVGNLIPVMGLAHLQRAGHRPIALVGGGTGMIGDPSGRASERSLNSLEVVEENVRGIRHQLERFLDFTGARGALMKNNAEWLMSLGAIEFMRDVGKHFTVNYMTAKDSVKSRLEGGISYTEFSYMLLQAYDYLELHKREGVRLQVGGSDQWGNITAGVELIRRSAGAEAHAVTFPLVTTAAGTKFGKSEAGAVWLDPAQTSPYRFYQFWINTDDRDVGKYLRFFTLLDRAEIESLDRAVTERPEARDAQRALALDVTSRVHGADMTRVAAEASRLAFDRNADPREFSAGVLESLMQELPSSTVTIDVGASAASIVAADGTSTKVPLKPVGDGAGLDVLDAFVAAGLVKSKGDARRLLQQGGLYANGETISADRAVLTVAGAIHGQYYVLRKGAREMAIVRLVGA
ncbi:MAG TPA: tyrosine--tRNA ligase [Gemmatimonadaceae bacterium]|nr:tyrosine--tRNA ligase [Gemmatimonadaceae bacterium]